MSRQEAWDTKPWVTKPWGCQALGHQALGDTKSWGHQTLGHLTGSLWTQGGRTWMLRFQFELLHLCLTPE